MGFKQVPLDLKPGLPPPRSIVSHGAMPVFATCPMISVTWDAYKNQSWELAPPVMFAARASQFFLFLGLIFVMCKTKI